MTRTELDLLQRVAALERDVTRLKESRSTVPLPFRVVDAAGHTVFEIGTQNDDHISLLLKTPNGAPVIGASATDNGNVVGVYNQDENIVSSLVAQSSGAGAVSACKSDGQPLATLLVNDFGGLVGITNNDGKIVGGLGAAVGGGRFGISAADGTEVLIGDVVEDVGLLTIYGRDAKPGMWLYADSDGGHLVVCDQAGNELVKLAIDSEAGHGTIRVLDRDGRELYSKP